MSERENRLGAAYAAGSPEAIARVYDEWAESYEFDMVKAGYRHPGICLALFARHVSPGSAPVLDAGAGTGLSGEWLGIIGYPQVEALDVSKRMLAVAASKQIYTKLHQAALGRELPFPDGYFAAIVSAGVFTTGHVGSEGLDELMRVCRPGGSIVLTVKTTLWEQDFSGKVERLAGEGRLAMLEQTEPYVSMPGEPGTVPSLAMAIRVT